MSLVESLKSFLPPVNMSIAACSIEGIDSAKAKFPEAPLNTPAGPTSDSIFPDKFDLLKSLSPLNAAATVCLK